jgi:hypothetical protein
MHQHLDFHMIRHTDDIFVHGQHCSKLWCKHCPWAKQNVLQMVKNFTKRVSNNATNKDTVD